MRVNCFARGFNEYYHVFMIEIDIPRMYRAAQSFIITKEADDHATNYEDLYVSHQ